jgi:putative Mg2+ transporter-C (MgtC) family protein
LFARFPSFVPQRIEAAGGFSSDRGAKPGAALADTKISAMSTMTYRRSLLNSLLDPFLSRFDLVAHLLVLLVAYILALPIAWDRERNERSAGLRTFPLVAIAACGFIQAAETVTNGNPEATARIVEGLINGVGFIGGGAILVGRASIRGTATAASLWATGAIGAAVGLGAYDIAIVLSAMTFFTLRFMTSFKTETKDAIPEPEISKNPPDVTP